MLNYISIGGQVEIYFFQAGTAQEVIAEYHHVVGRGMLPPFFALGVFQTITGNADMNQRDIDAHEALGVAIEGYFNPRMESAAYPLNITS